MLFQLGSRGELFIQFQVCFSFTFDFKDGISDLILLIPDYCLSFTLYVMNILQVFDACLDNSQNYCLEVLWTT